MQKIRRTLKRSFMFTVALMMVLSFAPLAFMASAETVPERLTSPNTFAITHSFAQVNIGRSLPRNEMDIGDTRVPLGSPDSLAYELYKLGLMQGVSTDEDGEPNFGLDRPPNRLQALILTIRLLGLEEEALAYEGENPFADVTAASQVPYVAYGFDKGITTGVSASSFSPTRLVTLREFTTFLLRVLGYDDREGDFLYVKALEMAVEVGLYSEEMVEDLSEGEFLRAEAVAAMVAALLTNIKDSDEILLIDTLVEAEVFTREKADAFIEVVTAVDEDDEP